MITTPKILLFRGRGIGSALIRWQTRGTYSHAALQGRDGRIIEAWIGKGVRSKLIPSQDWAGIDAYLAPTATAEQWDRALRWARSKLGCKYDTRSVLRFVTRNRPCKNDKWFCSELVLRATMEGGFPLLNTAPGRVSPDALSWSPLLKKAPQAREVFHT